MSVYKVTGPSKYRSHSPGTIFEAVLEPLAEARAIRRRSISLIERSVPRLREGSYSLPNQGRNERQKEEGSDA